MLIVRRVAGGFRFDILEPHDPSRADNLGKAQGLADFAEKPGDVFDRVQLIRRRPHGFARREMNHAAIRGTLRLATSNDQVDALFEAHS